ncbi:MAG: STAS domain-containing protein [Candidatus Margulisiibacteriota bacterium]|jgi:anti-anti-sigma factor
MFKVYEEKDRMIFSFSDRLDTSTISKIENEVIKKIVENKNRDAAVVFDLKDVEYISSSFLRLCVGASKEKGEMNFSIINVTPNVFKVFKMVGFDKLFEIKLIDWEF